MTRVENRLKELGYNLPTPTIPMANYVSTVRTGQYLYLSGVVPVSNGKIVFKGKVDTQVTIEEGIQAAKLCALQLISNIKDALGDLDKVVKLVKLTGFVNASPDFEKPYLLIDGASALLKEVFGAEKGGHARTSVGVATLPMNSSVEIELMIEVTP